MQAAVLLPYGSLHQETGLIMLLSNYLTGLGAEVSLLQCNGIFSLCDRDGERSWKRSLQSCTQCMVDSRTLAEWAGLPVVELSKFLLPEEVQASKHWVMGQEVTQLPLAEHSGARIADLCRGSFSARLGIGTWDLNNKNQEQVLRRLMLSALRMTFVSRRYLQKSRPGVVFIAGGSDFITQSMLAQTSQLGVDGVLCVWDVHARAIRLHHPRTGKVMESELILQGIAGMRADPKTWPKEVVSMLGDILRFLDLAESQLALPIAG